MKQLIGFIKHSIFLSIVFLLISIFFLCISLLYLQKRVGQIQTSAEVVSSMLTPSHQAYVKPIATSSAQIEPVRQNKTIIVSPTSSRTPTPSQIKEQSSTSTSSSSHTSTQTISPTSSQPTSTPATTPPQTTAPSDTQAEQVLQALNDYRSQHGAPTLEWSDKLGNYAQTRADKYAANGATDNHQDFQTLISTPAGFAQMGFSGLGENSSYGYPFNAADLIEKDYAADKPHDDNQLDPTWTHVGIGINGVASDIVFGK